MLKEGVDLNVLKASIQQQCAQLQKEGAALERRLNQISVELVERQGQLKLLEQVMPEPAEENQ